MAPKTSLKSEIALLPTLSRSFHLVQFFKCWQFFLKLNSERLYRSSGKENKVVVFCSRRSRAVTAKKCTKKRDARAELLFCQSKAIAFLPFSLLLPSSLLKFPNTVVFTLYVEARAMVVVEAIPISL